MTAKQANSCYICFSSEENNVEFGELMPQYDRSAFVVHYFCVLLSHDIPQNGEDEDDIYGILIDDIKKTVKGYSKTKCRYCHKPRAVSRCPIKSCNLRFHARCAIAKNCFVQFVEPNLLRIFCLDHSDAERHNVNLKFEKKLLKDIKARVNKMNISHSEKEVKIKQLINRISGRQFEEGNACMICGDPFTKEDLANQHVITPPCCWPKNGLKPDYRLFGLHRKCLKYQAFYSGYKFKCPYCTNARYFIEWCNEIGIFVPKRHALWEDSQIENRSLLGITALCSAEICHCPNGREFTDDDEMCDFFLFICTTCGSQSIHRKCVLNVPSPNTTFVYQCNMCNEYTRAHINPATNDQCDDFDDTMDIEDNNVPTIELHDTDSEPEYTPDQLFEEMCDEKLINIHVPKPILIEDQNALVHRRNHFRFQIQKWIKERKENGGFY